MGVDTCIEVRGVKISEEELRKAAGDLAECIGAEKFWVSPEEDKHCLEYNDEGNIVVNTFWRYYGPGYERGPWMEIRYTLIWLMNRFPNGNVYYFGDNSEANGCVTMKFLDEMDEHFITRGHVPYHSYFSGLSGDKKPQCSFCLREMANHGGGGAMEFYQCHGCNQKFIQEDGKTIKLFEKEDFFTGADRLRKEKTDAINN